MFGVNNQACPTDMDSSWSCTCLLIFQEAILSFAAVCENYMGSPWIRDVKNAPSVALGLSYHTLHSVKQMRANAGRDIPTLGENWQCWNKRIPSYSRLGLECGPLLGSRLILWQTAFNSCFEVSSFLSRWFQHDFLMSDCSSLKASPLLRMESVLVPSGTLRGQFQVNGTCCSGK